MWRSMSEYAENRWKPASIRRRQTPLGFLFVLAVGLLAGTISGIVGTGSSVMLMPVLVYQYGPKQAGAIMAGPPLVGPPSRHLRWGGRGRWPALRPPFHHRGSGPAPCAPP